MTLVTLIQLLMSVNNILFQTFSLQPLGIKLDHLRSITNVHIAEFSACLCFAEGAIEAVLPGV